jgi:hypothetical protein
VLVLTGARQTGKTSTLVHLFPNYSFVSLDLPTEAEQAEKDPASFLERHKPPVIIDEVQYAPGLFRHLKAEVDAHRDRNGQFLLTGSQKFQLMQNVAESLAGRADILEMTTLSLAEIRAALPETALETAIVRGGFPELYANLEIDPIRYYNSYLTTYLLPDVRALANVGSLRDFERFLRACALRSANVLNKANLARDVGISPSTANQWLSMLEASGQVVLLEPYFNNRTTSMVKSPKLYIADSGLLCALLNIRTVEELRDLCLCAVAGAGARSGPRWQPVFLARPHARGGFCGGSGRQHRAFRSEMDRGARQPRHGESGIRARCSRDENRGQRLGRLPRAEQLSVCERLSGDSGDGNLNPAFGESRIQSNMGQTTPAVPVAPAAGVGFSPGLRAPPGRSARRPARRRAP